MPTLRSFVNREVAPTLKAHGFRRKGNAFLRHAPNGTALVVELNPDNRGNDGLLAFSLGYAAIPQEVAHYRRWLNSPVGSWPTLSDSLIHGFASCPPDQPRTPKSWLFPYRWVVPDAQEARVGARLAAELTQWVEPRLRRWEDPAQLAEDLTSSQHNEFPGFHVGVARVLSLVPLGLRTARMQAALNQAADDDQRVVAWIRELKSGAVAR